MSTELVRRDQDAFELGKVFKASGMFPTMRHEAEAVVKIIAGREFGLGPMASVMGVHMVDGKPTLAANLIAGQIKRHPNYNYSVLRREDDGCALEFFENGKTCSRDQDGNPAPGTPSMTWDKKDATAAGLIGKANWKKYPRDMYFARCLTAGARTFCPDVLGGSPIYTAEELGADTQEPSYGVVPPLNSPEHDPAPAADIQDAEVVPAPVSRSEIPIGAAVLKQLRVVYDASGASEQDLAWMLLSVGVETLPADPSQQDIGIAMRSLTLEQAFKLEALIKGEDNALPGSGETNA